MGGNNTDAFPASIFPILRLVTVSVLILLTALTRATSRRYGSEETGEITDDTLIRSIRVGPFGNSYSKDPWTPCMNRNHDFDKEIGMDGTKICNESTFLCDRRQCPTGWAFKCCPLSPKRQTAMLTDPLVNGASDETGFEGGHYNM